MTGINKDALYESETVGMTAAEKRRYRALKDPYSRKEISHSLQQMIMGALHELGGQKWLVKQADKYPVAFMALVAKNLPFEARKAHDGETKIVVITSGNAEVIRQDAPGVLNTPLRLVDRRTIDAQVTPEDAVELDPLCEVKRYDKAGA